MTLEHRFRIASVTKLFVAAVVLQLVDEGAFELDGEVGLIEGGVTVRQLLNHTSGLPHGVEINELWEPYRENPAHRPEWTPRDMLGLIESRPRLSSPGEGWFYSGSNYVVLGLLIEDKTGSTLREELRRRVVEPLGLAETELPELSSTPAGLARGYLLPADNPVLPGPGPGPVDVSEVEPFGWGGGGMVSSARDVARFLRALLGRELFTPGMSAEMLSTVPSDWEESDGYGLGIEEVTSLWGIEQSTCGSAWGHLGFAFGYTTIALGSRRRPRGGRHVQHASHVRGDLGRSGPPRVGVLLRLNRGAFTIPLSATTTSGRTRGTRARTGRAGGARAKRLPRGDELGATVYELGPGNWLPFHFHHGSEEYLVVLRGRPTLRTGDGSRELAEGDAVHFPHGPDGAHGLANETDEPVRLLMASTLVSPEVAEYPDHKQITAQARTGSQTGDQLWLIHDVEPPDS